MKLYKRLLTLALRANFKTDNDDNEEGEEGYRDLEGVARSMAIRTAISTSKTAPMTINAISAMDILVRWLGGICLKVTSPHP